MRAGRGPARHTTALMEWKWTGISGSRRVTAAGLEPGARAGAEPGGPGEGAGPTALRWNHSPALRLQFPALPLGAAAKLSGPGFQPGRFSSRAPVWLPPGPRAWPPPCVRFPDSSRRLWSPSLPQAPPADMFAKAFRVKSNTAIKGSDRWGGRGARACPRGHPGVSRAWPARSLSVLGQPTWGGGRGAQPEKGPQSAARVS